MTTTALDRSREKAERMIENARSRKDVGGSAQSALTAGSVGGGTFGNDRNAQTAKAQYDRNTSWTYAAVRPIMNRVAAQQVRVARVIPNGDKGAMTRSQLAAVPQFVKGFLTKTTILPNSASLEILDQHPFLDAIRDPNGIMTRYSLMATLAASLQLAGKGYWWITRSKRHENQNDIWSLPAHWVKPDHAEGFRASWLVRPAGTETEFRVDGDSMAYFNYPNVADPFGSYSPVEAGARDILINESLKESQHRSYENDIVPGLAITLGKTAIGVDGKAEKPQAEPHQISQLEARLNQLYRGPGKSRKFILLDRLIDSVDRISNTPNEMDYLDSGSMAKKAIMQIFGVNEIIAGEVEGANRASAVVADETFLANVINPLLSLITEILNKTVLPLYRRGDENIVTWVDEAVTDDPDSRRADWALGYQMRAVTRDEFRADVLNLPPLPNETGNSFVMGVGEIIQPAGEDLTPLLLPEPASGDDEDDLSKSITKSHEIPALPAPPPMTINLSMPPTQNTVNVQQPEIKAGDVTVNPTHIIETAPAVAPVVTVSPEITVQPAEVKDSTVVVNVQPSDVVIEPTINVEPTPVNVTVESPDVNVDVAAPDVSVSIEAPNVKVDVAAPDVNVEAPDVTVNVEQPATKPKEIHFERDDRGNIIGAEIE